jgi:hypothetical protein
MKRFLLAYVLITALLIMLTTGCTTMGSLVSKDPRCQPRQHCPYTDAPTAVRTEAIR